MRFTLGRLRRPTAWAAAATLLAVILPAMPATAAAVSGSATFSGGSLTVGQSATFDITCSGLPNSPGASVRLQPYGAEAVATQEPVMILTDPETPTYSGQVTFDLTGVAPGMYAIGLDCYEQWDGYVPLGAVLSELEIVAADVATTTSVTAVPAQVVTGDQVTFTASVPGAVGGSVEFQLGGTSLGTAPLTGGSAALSTAVTGSGTVTATYSGAPGYLASTSAGVPVSVITSITGPEGYGISGTPRVGSTVSAQVFGQWSPTPAQRLTVSYSWTIDGHVVSTASSYTPVAADLGKQLTLTLTGSHPKLGSLPLTTSTVVQAAPAVYGDLVIDGAVDHQATLGTPLTAKATGWSATATLGYTWHVNGEQVSTAASYTPRAADLGKTISLQLTVTEAGHDTLYDHAYVWNVLTTPVVTVGSSTVTVGKDAVIPVTVAGPAGGPVPTGSVAVTLVPVAGGDPVTPAAVTLNGSGKATVQASGLPVGRYTVTAAYRPTEQQYSFARFSVVAEAAGNANPYRAATGTGTVTVVKPAVTADFPRSLTVPVATAATATLQVTGTARPAEYVLLAGSTELLRGTLPALGGVTLTLPVLEPGTHQLTLVLPETATTARYTQDLTVTVTGEPARTGAPTAKLATPQAATVPGQAMELVADGFLPGETVAFFVHSDPVYLGTAVAGADGIARLTAVIPAGLPLGSHTVIATGGTSGRWAELPIELAVAGAPPATTQLAVTGAGAGSGLAAAWLLLGAGAVLLIVVRRVRAVRGAA